MVNGAYLNERKFWQPTNFMQQVRVRVQNGKYYQGIYIYIYIRVCSTLTLFRLSGK